MENDGMTTHISSNEMSGLHHDCQSCGGSCQGAIVALLDQNEKDRIERLGIELGVDNPIEEGRLRQQDGRCVFLQQDGLCRIHGHAGWKSKPTLCKQFPLVAIRAQDGLRVGVDPACFHSWRGWVSGESIEIASIVVGKVERSASEMALETRLIHFCESGTATIGALSHWLCGVKPNNSGEFPHFFVPNILNHLKQVGLRRILSSEVYPMAIHKAMEPFITQIERLDQMTFPELRDSKEDEWGVEALRRLLFLRLTHGIPTVAAACLLIVMGIVACMAVGLRGDDFCRTLAAWVRLLRFPKFWSQIVPDQESMARLVRIED